MPFTLLHSEQPKLHRVLAVLSAIGLIFHLRNVCMHKTTLIFPQTKPHIQISQTITEP